MVSEKMLFKVFPIINLWNFYVAMATRVPIQSALIHVPYAAFPSTYYDILHEI